MNYLRNLLLLFFYFFFISCLNNEVVGFESSGSNLTTDNTGRQYDFLDSSVLSYCGPLMGRKMCRFLNKYDGTLWADVENYYSNFSDIKFSNFTEGRHFISFFNLNNDISFCKGWKLKETTLDGLKWFIKIKKDEEDVFWFQYDYYGMSEEIEYSKMYKYEVIDGLLHFSSSENETFIFHPSEKV